MNDGLGETMMLRGCLLVIAISLLALLAPEAFASNKDEVRPDVATVRALYSDFAEEAVFDEPMSQKNLVDQPRGVLIRFFTHELSELIVQDNECAARTHEICNLDFSPIWDSQDPTGATVSIFEQRDLGVVAVVIHYPDKEMRRLIFRLAKEPMGWRIADIVYAGDRPTLSQLLKQEH